MKKLILSAALLCGICAQAHAMDEAERNRQMQLYGAYNQTGAGMVTTTTTVQPAMAPASSATVEQMSPLNDDGTPMNTPARAAVLGTTTASSTQTQTLTQSDGFAPGRKSAHEREMEAYQAYQAANGVPASTTTTTTVVAAPMMITATGMPATTTTTENTTTTNYTVTKRKVGLVGNRPYPALTSEMPGGVVTETTVNGVASAPQVVVPDPVAPLKDQKATGDYYSSAPGAQVYAGTVGNVRLHKTGQFN